MGFGNLAMTGVYLENTKKKDKGKQLSLTRQKKQNQIKRAPLKLNSDLLINFVKANKEYWRQGLFLKFRTMLVCFEDLKEEL